MRRTIALFNECKRAIGQLQVKFDSVLSPAERTALTKAWSDWSIIDRVGRQRARNTVRSILGNRAQDVLNLMDQFNKESAT